MLKSENVYVAEQKPVKVVSVSEDGVRSEVAISSAEEAVMASEENKETVGANK